MRLPPVALTMTLLAPTVASAAGVAFVGVEGLGLERATVQPIERLLERAIADQVGAGLLSPDQITARLLDPSLEGLRGCNGDVTCLVDLGGVLEVDLIIYGTLTRLGENFVIVLKTVDVAAGGESNRIRNELAGAEDQLVEAIRTAAFQLLSPEGFQGTIVFEELPMEAMVAIDGEEVGAFAGEPFDVTVGRHAVTITSPGSEPRSLLVDVLRNEVTRVDAGLAVAGPTSAAATISRHDFLGKWWPVGAMGAGGALLATGTTLGVVTLVQESRFEDDFRTRATSADDMRAAYDRGQSYARWTNITLGAGAVVAGIGAAGWLLQEDPPGAVDTFLYQWRQPLLLGVGGAALAGGTALAILTAREEAAFEDSFRTNPGDEAALRDSFNRGRSYALWANVVLTVGLMLTSAGLVDLFFVGQGE